VAAKGTEELENAVRAGNPRARGTGHEVGGWVEIWVEIGADETGTTKVQVADLDLLKWRG
jgi:hypothetical protein